MILLFTFVSSKIFIATDLECLIFIGLRDPAILIKIN